MSELPKYSVELLNAGPYTPGCYCGYVVQREGQQRWKSVMYRDCTAASTGTNEDVFRFH